MDRTCFQKRYRGVQVRLLSVSLKNPRGKSSRGLISLGTYEQFLEQNDKILVSCFSGLSRLGKRLTICNNSERQTIDPSILPHPEHHRLIRPEQRSPVTAFPVIGGQQDLVGAFQQAGISCSSREKLWNASIVSSAALLVSAISFGCPVSRKVRSPRDSAEDCLRSAISFR